MENFYNHLDGYLARPDALSKSAFAEASGISRNYLYEIIRREAVPSIDVAERMANAMGTDLSRLFSVARMSA